MEEQDVTMSSADAEPSPTTIISSDHELDMRRHSPLQQNGQNGVDDPPPSPGAESVSTGAASSDDGDSDEDEDEGAEENERVDENGAIVIDDDDDDDDERGGTSNDIQEPSIIIKDEPSPSNAAPVLLNESKNAPKPNSETANKAENHLPPPTSTATTKPKSKAKAKARSPSPLPIAPLPLQTVRLAIKLGGPDNYTVDISGLAKESGQRPLTPVPKRQDESSDSEIEKAKVAEANQSGSEKPKKKVITSCSMLEIIVLQVCRRRKMLPANIMTFQTLSLTTLSLLLTTGSSLHKLNNRVSMFPQEKLLS